MVDYRLITFLEQEVECLKVLDALWDEESAKRTTLVNMSKTSLLQYLSSHKKDFGCTERGVVAWFSVNRFLNRAGLLGSGKCNVHGYVSTLLEKELQLLIWRLYQYTPGVGCWEGGHPLEEPCVNAFKRHRVT
jgi:hypothetical protein